MEEAARKLIIALDGEDLVEAQEIVAKTKSYARTFKIGLAMFSAHGPRVVEIIRAMGVEVFLDLKLCDIPMQVENAIQGLGPLSVKYLTVHALGGFSMLKAAHDVAIKNGITLLAVSLLTSLDDTDYKTLGFQGDLKDGVLRLAEIAYRSGIRGFVSSPKEALAIKQQFCGDCFVVCPGIRSIADQKDDQRRTSTIAESMKEGADALIVGRPITKSPDVSATAKIINQEIRAFYE